MIIVIAVTVVATIILYGYAYLNSNCLLGHKPAMLPGTIFILCENCEKVMKYDTGKITWGK